MSKHTTKNDVRRYLARSFPKAASVFRWLEYQQRKGRVRQLYHYLTAGHLIRSRRINSFSKCQGLKKLQVGGGYHIKRGENWLNGDLIAGEIYMNATKRLPFTDNSIDVIFTEQFIEHLSQGAAIIFMKEAYRVLRRGGVIRQSTPDLEKLISVYLNESPGISLNAVIDRHMKTHRKGGQTVVANGCQLINDQFSLWGHQFIYDKETLKALTEKVGFVGFKWTEFGVSDRSDLSNLERHADVEWMKSEISMFCEARKPTETANLMK